MGVTNAKCPKCGESLKIDKNTKKYSCNVCNLELDSTEIIKDSNESNSSDKLKTNSKSNTIKNKDKKNIEKKINELISVGIEDFQFELSNDACSKLKEISLNLLNYNKENLYAEIFNYASNRNFTNIFKEGFPKYTKEQKSFLIKKVLKYFKLKINLDKNSFDDEFSTLSTTNDFKNHYEKEVDKLLFEVDTYLNEMTDDQKQIFLTYKFARIKFLENYILYIYKKYSPTIDENINEVYVCINTLGNIFYDNQLILENKEIQNYSKELAEIFKNNAMIFVQNEYIRTLFIFESLLKLPGVSLDLNELLSFNFNFNNDISTEPYNITISPNNLIISYPNSNTINIDKEDILFVNKSSHIISFSNSSGGKQYWFYDIAFRVNSEKFSIIRLVDIYSFDKLAYVPNNFKIFNSWLIAHKIKSTENKWQNKITISETYLGLSYEEYLNIDEKFSIEKQQLDNLIKRSNLKYKILLSLFFPILLFILLLFLIFII